MGKNKTWKLAVMGHTIDWLREKRHWPLLSVLTLFSAEAAWLSIRAAYPMAYDESYHFQLIQFFSHHLNPIVSSQDPSTYGLGNIVQNTSWLYHYLMSFPYRLFELNSSQYVQVVGLRFINIGIMIGALALVYRLLDHLKLSITIRTFIVFLVALTPAVTALSAQINYDSLVILLSLGATYYTLCFVRELRISKPSAITFAKLITLAFLGLIAKFSFLPMFAGIALATTAAWYWQVRAGKKPLTLLRRSFRTLSLGTRAVIIVILTVSVGIASGLYANGLVRYHSLTPSCEQVLSVEACSNYYPWERNYTLSLQRNDLTKLDGPLVYTYHWAVQCWYQLHGVIIPGGGIVDIARSFYVLLLAFTLFALIALITHIHQVLRRYPLLLPLLGIAVIYILGLWMRNYNDYRHLGDIVGVQGRYIIPVTAYFYTALVLGVHESLRGNKRKGMYLQRLKLGLVAFVVWMFVWFGGSVRYMSDVLPDHRWRAQLTAEYRVS
jgi:hypothetical protein